MKFRKDDMVEVITGDDAGDPEHRVIRKVIRVLPEENKVVVENINRVYKHLKPSRANPQGGRLSKEMPLDASNVMLYCPTCRRGVRVGQRYDPADGHKERFCRSCKATLRSLSKPRKAYVKKTAK